MIGSELFALLEKVKREEMSTEEALGILQNAPFKTTQLPFAELDHHRSLRQGIGEVVYGESKTMSASNASVKEPLVYLLVGAIFIYLPTGINLLVRTTFGRNAEILAYAPINSPSNLLALFGSGSPVAEPLTMFIQMIGLIAFIRGWVLIARASGHGQQPGGTGKGLMHVFGGIVALNIVKSVEVINATLYG